MCCFDCELMPKLQHIRVAGKFFVGYEIPKNLEHLWQYIGEMYRLDAFSQSCPADQVSWDDTRESRKLQLLYHLTESI